MNRPPPQNPPELEPGPPLNIDTGDMTKLEILTALKSLKNGKAAGTDNIPAEALKERVEIVDHLQNLLSLLWTTEEIPTDWKRGSSVK